MLTFATILAFYAMGIELLKKIVIEITFMIFGQQIKNMRWKKLVLMKFYWAGFEE